MASILNSNIDKNICPITLVPVTELKEPVITPDGWTYEKEAIVIWITKNGTSPVNPSKKLTLADLIPNRILNSDSQPSKKLSDENCKDFCVCWDVSGSMAARVEVEIIDGKKENTGLTNHDLVKHALKTSIHTLGKKYSENSKYRLSIVIFQSSSKLLLPLTHMNPEGVKKALAEIEKPSPGGGTNLNAGLEMALKNVPNGNVYLLTDGEPNHEPPRGYIGSINRFLEREVDEKKNKITSKVRTFGFGYSLNADLLQKFAHLFNGTFGFIPDVGLIGTVFVHALANDLYKLNNYKKPATKTESEELFVTLLDSLIEIERNSGNIEDGNSLIDAYIQQLNSKTDKQRNNISKMELWEPEIKKAFSRNDWYQKWGRFYIRSLRDAHVNQECNNFKDVSIKGYKNEIIGKMVDEFDDIFCDLPAPEPSVKSNPYTNHYRGGSFNTRSAQMPRPVVNMRTFSQPSAGCFSGDCEVNVSVNKNGEQVTEKRSLKNLKKGDLVETNTGKFSAIQCIVKTKCPNNKVVLYTIGQLKSTPWHPIYIPSTKSCAFPIDLARETATEYHEEFVYSFVVENAQYMKIEGQYCITLGHGIKDDPVARHSFWGTQSVIKCLQQKESWEEGVVEISKSVRNSYGIVIAVE